MGDVIVEYDGQKIGRTPELSRMVAATPVGKKVTRKVLRDGKETSLSLTIARLTEKTPFLGARVDAVLGGLVYSQEALDTGGPTLSRRSSSHLLSAGA